MYKVSGYCCMATFGDDDGGVCGVRQGVRE